MIALARPDNVVDFPAQVKVKSSEWYTPSVYIEAARTVMNGIDLDPASHELANRTVRAKRFYSAQENGLLQEWKADSAWLNPPYGTTNGQSNQGIWARRLIHEYQRGNVKEAILLVTSATDMKWFGVLWDFPLCFVEHKIHFYGTKLENKEHPQGACMVYLGPNEQKFVETFQKFGTIVKRISEPRCQVRQASLWERPS